MAQAVRTAWNASRHWLATGFLAPTILLLLLMCMNRQNEHRGIDLQKATASESILPLTQSLRRRSSTERQVRSGLDSIRGLLGGMIGGVLGSPEVSG